MEDSNLDCRERRLDGVTTEMAYVQWRPFAFEVLNLQVLTPDRWLFVFYLFSFMNSFVKQATSGPCEATRVLTRIRQRYPTVMSWLIVTSQFICTFRLPVKWPKVLFCVTFYLWHEEGKDYKTCGSKSSWHILNPNPWGNPREPQEDSRPLRRKSNSSLSSCIIPCSDNLCT